jgi:hypothetical protein
MLDALVLDYTVARNRLGEEDLVPQLPLTLSLKDQMITVSGLLDTGAAVSVLPYRVGRELGGTWDEQAKSVPLTGTLAELETRPIVLSASVGQFAPVRLIFVWVQTDEIPIILGQTNFFMEFDVCFYRSREIFEVRVRQ